MRLILASGSPRRAEILRSAGFSFEVRPAAVDEVRLEREDAEAFVRRLAAAKAEAIAEALCGQSAIVIGADTTVLVDGSVLEKPVDEGDARRMLRALSGRVHEVMTGVALVRVPDTEMASFVESTRVWFVEISDAAIEGYIATREPFDKAGGYGIQGVGGRFVSRIEGCYFNVIGLPVSRVWRELVALGWKDDREKIQNK